MSSSRSLPPASLAFTRTQMRWHNPKTLMLESLAQNVTWFVGSFFPIHSIESLSYSLTTSQYVLTSLQKARHVSMIALAGTIGTGLFLGSGSALANGGPVGFFLGYTIVGCLVGMMMYCLGEM